MSDGNAPDQFVCWHDVATARPDGEAALFARVARRLASGSPPDMMGDDEAALEALAAERGYELMTASVRRGDATPATIDPAYFACLDESEAALLERANDEGARGAVAFLMTCLRDAFDLGRGRGMAGGEQAMLPASSDKVH
jgi:hypothetical protein